MTNILNIKAFPTVAFIAGAAAWVVNYQSDFQGESDQTLALDGKGTTNTSTTPFKTYSDFVTAAVALQNTASINVPANTDMCNDILALTNADVVAQSGPAGYYTSYNLEFVDAPVETQIQKDIMASQPETLSGTTNASGDVTFTFAKTYASVPDVYPMVQLPSTVDNAHATYVAITALSTTSCTVRAQKGVNTGILLGGTVDPDAIVATGTKVSLLVFK